MATEVTLGFSNLIRDVIRDVEQMCSEYEWEGGTLEEALYADIFEGAVNYSTIVNIKMRLLADEALCMEMSGDVYRTLPFVPSINLKLFLEYMDEIPAIKRVRECLDSTFSNPWTVINLKTIPELDTCIFSDLGDFRVNEWNSENLDNLGNYRGNAVDETVSEPITKSLVEQVIFARGGDILSSRYRDLVNALPQAKVVRGKECHYESPKKAQLLILPTSTTL